MIEIKVEMDRFKVRIDIAEKRELYELENRSKEFTRKLSQGQKEMKKIEKDG